VMQQWTRCKVDRQRHQACRRGSTVGTERPWIDLPSSASQTDQPWPQRRHAAGADSRTLRSMSVVKDSPLRGRYLQLLLRRIAKRSSSEFRTTCDQRDHTNSSDFCERELERDPGTAVSELFKDVQD
jgi:hypothetical protein